MYTRGAMALDGGTPVSYSGISPSNADGEKRNRIRVIRSFYYRFAFSYRFFYTEERAGETRAEHARNSS
jgi:hypothetical protein